MTINGNFRHCQEDLALCCCYVGCWQDWLWY